MRQMRDHWYCYGYIRVYSSMQLARSAVIKLFNMGIVDLNASFNQRTCTIYAVLPCSICSFRDELEPKINMQHCAIRHIEF